MFSIFSGKCDFSPSINHSKLTSSKASYIFTKKSSTPKKIPSLEIDSSFNPFNRLQTRNSNAFKNIRESLFSGFDTTISKLNLDEELKIALEQTPKVFQLKKYIITTTRSGLLIINQNRAHQRVLYEKFLTSFTERNINSQQLVFPKEVELSNKQMILYNEYEENLKVMGFVSELQENKLIIAGVPAICEDRQIEKLFEDIFIDTENSEEVESFSQGDFIAKLMSRSIAITGNKSLTTIEQQALVDDLFACKEPLTCPFNRKIFINLDIEELDKKLN